MKNDSLPRTYILNTIIFYVYCYLDLYMISHQLICILYKYLLSNYCVSGTEHTVVNKINRVSFAADFFRTFWYLNSIPLGAEEDMTVLHISNAIYSSQWFMHNGHSTVCWIAWRCHRRNTLVGAEVWLCIYYHCDFVQVTSSLWASISLSQNRYRNPCLTNWFRSAFVRYKTADFFILVITIVDWLDKH